MRKVFINVQKLKEKESAHPYLKKRLKLPEYYGHNLDALFDVLTSLGEETTIYLMQEEVEKESYAGKVVETIWEAAKENGKVKVKRLS